MVSLAEEGSAGKRREEILAGYRWEDLVWERRSGWLGGMGKSRTF